MKNMMNYILESSNIQSLKDYIMSEILKLQDEQILSEIRSILISHNMDPEFIEKYFTKRHLGDCYKLILSKFNSFGDIESLQLMINQGGSDITSENFLNAPNKNIYKVFQDICNKNTLESLCILNPPNKNNVTRGKLEVLLNTILKDIDENGRGDVPTIMSGTIEVKGSGGMIKGQFSYNIPACTSKFNEIFSKIGKAKDVFESQKTLNELLINLQHHYTNEEILMGVVDCYFAKYPLDVLNNAKVSIIKTQFQQFLLNNQKQIFLKSKVDSKLIWDAFLVTDFKFYQLLDNWDNLVVFNNDGKYDVLNAETEIKSTYDNVLRSLKNKGIKRITSSIKINDSRYQAIKIAIK